jgi:hypothetical protein
MKGITTSKISLIIPLLITICIFGFPAYAKYSSGNGTADDPYQIASIEDLILLGKSPADYDKSFILTSDINLDPNLPGGKVFEKAIIAPDNNDENYRFQGTPFYGEFDGNSHKISHLTITGGSYLGLFGQLGSGAKISNLGLVDVNITGSNDYVGGLVGTNSGNVTRCYSTGVVNGDGHVGGLVGKNYGHVIVCYSTGMVSGNRCVGGLVGSNDGRVLNCYSTDSVSGKQFVGGLVGENDGHVMVCYSTATVSGTGGCVGGLVGRNWGSIISSYSTGKDSGNNNVGGLVGRNYGNITTSFWDIVTSGQPSSAGGTGKTTAEMQTKSTFLDAGWDFVGEVWNGTCDYWQMSQGDYPKLHYHADESPVIPEGLGTSEEPYLIRDVHDLGTVWYKPTACYRLENSVDLSGITWPMAVIPWFDGTFDGNGYVISNLTIRGGGLLGMCGQLASEAKISNLGLEDVYVNGTDSFVGGLVGSSRGNINTSYSTGEVNGDGYVGGLVGSSRGYITTSYSTGEVNGDGYYVGGLVGRNWDSMTTCYSTGMVSGNRYVGGLVGSNSGGITTSYSIGEVNGDYDVGGLVGENDGHVIVCYSTGMVSGSRCVGGLVGSNNGCVLNCYSTDSVSGKQFVGGLVGSNHEGCVSRCYSTGTVSGNRWGIGGLVGRGNPGLATYCLWDIQTSRQTTSDGGIAKTTTEMQTAATFLEAGWDFIEETKNGTEDIWWILEGQDYPRLIWEFSEGLLLRSLLAFCPEPPDGATGVARRLILRWSPGVSALRHDIYLGEDEDVVKNATIESHGVYRGRQTGDVTSYDPGKLELDTTYYWRIDEVKETDPNSPWKGPVWSFTTGDFIVVDDFESYNDLDVDIECTRIYCAWIDGYEDPNNGSIVGYFDAPYTERTIVHSGRQSMPLFYDNSGPANYSEATMTLTSLRDWTEEGVGVLLLWFYGDPNNAPETMYIALTNYYKGPMAVVHHDNPNATQIGNWTEWAIDLQEFADQDLNITNVNSITIGFGNRTNPVAGGAGLVFFDDIHLYRSTP